MHNKRLPLPPPPPTAPAIVTVATMVTALSNAITPALVQQEDTAALAQQEAPASAPKPTSAHAKWDLPVLVAQKLQLIQAQHKLEEDRRQARWPPSDAPAGGLSLLTEKAHQDSAVHFRRGPADDPC